MSSEACCTPAPPATPEVVGKEDTLAGYPVYTSGSASSPSAVILVSDIFGYRKPLIRKLADRVATSGHFVVVPDVLKDDPFTGSYSGGEFGVWLEKHPPTGYGLEVVKGLVEALKDKSIGIGGFCWGAKSAIVLAKEKVVKAIVQLHPSVIEATDYKEVAVPICVLASPTDGVDEYVELLEARKDVESYVKIFPGVAHGWTLRYDETNEVAKGKAVEAHNLMIDWFAKYL